MKFLAILVSFSAATRAATIAPRDVRQISVPPEKPDDAPVVPKNFVGFGIESAFITNFSNNFSEHLVSALASRMGQPPVLRVGGTGGDYIEFDPHQEEPKKCRKNDCDTHHGWVTVGPKFFNAYKWFPDARFIVQAPVSKEVDANNSQAFVWHAWESLGHGERVEAIALGNEVEVIYKEGADAYVTAARDVKHGILTNLSLSVDEAKIFEVGNTASGAIGNSETYQVDDILEAGFNRDKNISTAAEHWYQVMDEDVVWTDEVMQRRMINHKTITERFNDYEPSMKASREAGINYAITEGAAALNGAQINFTCGFGYTLWAVDFNLAAMARGVSRVTNLAGRPGAKRQFWAPDNSGNKNGSPGPQVRAPFPAAIFVADFLGKDEPSAVTELKSNIDVVGAYAAYGENGGNLQRVAIVNMQLFNGTDGSAERGVKTFEVEVGDVNSVRVQRLHADRGIAAMGYDFGGEGSNVSWAGEQWSYKVNEGKGHFDGEGTEEETVKVTGGVASVKVPDSEAVIIFVE